MTWLLVLAAALGIMPEPVPPELSARVQRLAAELGSTDPALHAAAEMNLLALGADAAGPLVGCVREAPPAQLQAIQALLPRFGPAAVPRLFRTAERDLGHVHEVRNEAMVAVGRMGAPAIPALRLILASGAGTTFATQALGVMGPPGLAELRALVAGGDSQLRREALTVLASYPESASVPTFLAALNSSDPEFRLQALRGLGPLALPETADAIGARLADENEGVRQWAAAVVVQVLTPRLREALIAAARDDSSALVRKAAARGLSRVKDDPLAARMGRRYLPTTTADPEEGPPRILLVLRLALVGLLLYGLAWAAARVGGPAAWGAAVASAGVGLYWGRFATGVNGDLERLLLGACVPAVAWLCWFAGPRLRALILPLLGLATAILALVLAPVLGVVIGLWAFASAPLWLVVALALGLAGAVWAGRGADVAALRAFRRAALPVLTAFYAGYAAGFWALWRT